MTPSEKAKAIIEKTIYATVARCVKTARHGTLRSMLVLNADGEVGGNFVDTRVEVSLF